MSERPGSPSRSSLRVTRRFCDEGEWETASGAPHSALRDYVIGYVGLKSRLAVPRERHLPSGEAALVLNLGPAHEIIGYPSAIRFRNVAIMGLHDRPFITESGGYKRLVVIRLTPPGAHRLVEIPMELLLNRWVELDEIDRPLYKEVVDATSELDEWAPLFRSIDSLIRQRLAEQPLEEPVLSAWKQIRDSRGQNKIEPIARNLGWSHKRLLAEFRRCVGLPPKTMAKVVRFNRLLRFGRNDGRVAWARAALDCGYFDQAHMIHEFRTFAGGTPTEIAQMRVGYTLRED